MQLKLVAFLALVLPAIALPLVTNIGDDISSVTSRSIFDSPLDDINNHVIGPLLIGLGVVKRGSGGPLADIR
ncbi:hypothetical protein AAF712_009533 [Marasmius tenuissimus]|uniref:Uncharacterized protein n=1 Tax=Marasmius tenuissimus TaxID=585030 RepID=A0ABR2ZRP3_9AGAR|nr:hypothetical protein PM082_006657 [Marasmius tenuissimus]